MAKFLIVFGFMIAGVAFAEKYPFERYQPIVDRQMFGQPPIGFDPTKMASEVSKSAEKELTKEQEEIKSSIHFSIINVTPSGKTAVGFTDNSDAKTPVHYYLKVGESAGGWTLKEADALKAWMKIEKNGVEVELTLGQNSAKGGGSTSKTAASAPPKASTLDLKPKVGARSTLLGRKNSSGGLRDINQLRAERQAQREAAEAKAAEERAKQEAERDEMRASLAEMKEQLAEQRKLREEAEANAKAQEELKAKEKVKRQVEGEVDGQEESEGGENEENND